MIYSKHLSTVDRGHSSPQQKQHSLFLTVGNHEVSFSTGEGRLEQTIFSQLRAKKQHIAQVVIAVCSLTVKTSEEHEVVCSTDTNDDKGSSSLVTREGQRQGPLRKVTTWPSYPKFIQSPGSCNQINTHKARGAAVPSQLPLDTLQFQLASDTLQLGYMDWIIQVKFWGVKNTFRCRPPGLPQLRLR